MRKRSRTLRAVTVLCLAGAIAACAAKQQPADRTTSRDKTKKGAAIGAASGAVLGAILGEGDLDKILAGAAIGAGVGAGVGAYMDRQEEKLARIPGTTVERVGEDMLLVHFDSDVLFAVDSAVLDPDSRRSLEQAAAVFIEFPKTAIISQGHTDSTGSEEHNLALSERRAKAVMNYLIGRGVDAGRITAVGYGEGNPVADNGSEAGRQQNRRVDLLLKAKAT
jgi:outer membrane protein OmpA-like peptidoglycan-associated protein